MTFCSTTIPIRCVILLVAFLPFVWTTRPRVWTTPLLSFHHHGRRRASATTNCFRSLLLRGGADEEEKPPTGNGNHTTAAAAITTDREPKGFTILSETILHDNWRKLTSRKVQLPSRSHQKDGAAAAAAAKTIVADFEIVSQGDRGGRVSDQAVMIFVWHTATQTATLIREYMPSVHAFMTGLAAGMVEEKHEHAAAAATSGAIADDAVPADNRDPVYTAAVHELEEECRLQGGTWYRLSLPTVMDKYSTTKISAYLVLDPVPVAQEEWKERDETEAGMQIVEGISLAELQELLASGGLTIVAGWATQLALSRLRELNEIE